MSTCESGLLHMFYSTYAEHVHSANAECYAILCETFVTVMGKFSRFARLHGYSPVAQKQQPLTRHYNSWLKLQSKFAENGKLYLPPGEACFQ